MPRHGTGSMAKLVVPYYEQSLDYTCGPACLMMAIGSFDPGLNLDQATELEIWREATWVEPRGCSMYGLALAAHRRGYKARMVTNLEDDEALFQMVKERRPEIDVGTMRFMQEDLVRRCHAAGMMEERREVTLEDIQRALEAGEVPILLTSTAITAKEDIPHWIIVRGLEDGRALINNPYIEDGKKVEAVDLTRLEEHVGFHGWQSLVTISRPRRPRRRAT